jgi:hypothetical protein
MTERLAALLAAPVLLLLPFLLFGGGDHHGGAAPHADHDPRHGGRVVMIGDHHVEIVERGGAVEIYPSDAVRRPLPLASGRAISRDGSAHPLAWERDRLLARPPVADTAERYEIAVPDGPVLALPAR